MEEAELEKQRNMVTRSSIKRKPFANLTNIVRKPYPISPFSQSKRPGSSTASDSSIGSTQNPNHENHPLISSPDQPLLSTSPTLTPGTLSPFKDACPDVSFHYMQLFMSDFSVSRIILVKSISNRNLDLGNVYVY